MSFTGAMPLSSALGMGANFGSVCHTSSAPAGAATATINAKTSVRVLYTAFLLCDRSLLIGLLRLRAGTVGEPNEEVGPSERNDSQSGVEDGADDDRRHRILAGLIDIEQLPYQTHCAAQGKEQADKPTRSHDKSECISRPHRDNPHDPFAQPGMNNDPPGV